MLLCIVIGHTCCRCSTFKYTMNCPNTLITFVFITMQNRTRHVHRNGRKKTTGIQNKWACVTGKAIYEIIFNFSLLVEFAKNRSVLCGILFGYGVYICNELRVSISRRTFIHTGKRKRWNRWNWFCVGATHDKSPRTYIYGKCYRKQSKLWIYKYCETKRERRYDDMP